MLQPPQAQCCRADINMKRAVNHDTATGKISRTPKTCPFKLLETSADGVNKMKSVSLSLVNSISCPMSSSSSASKMSHLVVRRPPSNLRTSRADFVPLAFKNDKVPILSQGLSSLGVSARPSHGVGVLPHVGRVEIHSPNSKVKPFSFSPQPALADGERSDGKENKLNVKVFSGVALNSASVKAASSLYPPQNKSVFVKWSSAKFPGELDDDREELLFAADFARNASYRACSDSFWRKLECYFASVTSHNELYLKHQLEFADAISGSLYQIPEDENDDSDDPNLQEHTMYSGGRRKSPADQESTGTATLSACSDINKTLSEAPTLNQILISALIEDDESKGMSLHSEGMNDFQCASDAFHCNSCNYNRFEAENRDGMAFKDNNCEAKSRHLDHEVDSQLRKQGLIARKSQSDIGSSLESFASPISSPNCNYHTLSVEDNMKVQLQGNYLFPKTHQIAEGEDPIDKDIIELEARLLQQEQKKMKHIRKIYESIQDGKNAEKRNLEQAAMSKLVEMAYKRQRVSHGSHSSKRVLRRVSKKAALPFVERTLSKCREFEDSGRSCFRKAALQNIIFSTLKSNSVPNSVDKQASRSSKSKYRSSPSHNLQPKGSGSRDKQQYMGMNRNLLPNEVCSDSSRAMPGGSVKGKRSMRSVPRIAPNDGRQDQDWKGRHTSG